MMRMKSISLGLLFLLAVGFVTLPYQMVEAGDPELTTDFATNATTDADFTFTGFRNLSVPDLGQASLTIASYTNVQGLLGLGITAAVAEFGPLSQIDPHHHPRATEVLFVLSGEVEAGFVDTENNLYKASLEKDDLFIIPKGLVHYVRNNGLLPASVVAFLNSENPGVLLEVSALFTSDGTGLPVKVLATALNTTLVTVAKIKAGLN